MLLCAGFPHNVSRLTEPHEAGGLLLALQLWNIRARAAKFRLSSLCGGQERAGSELAGTVSPIHGEEQTCGSAPC